LVGLDVRTREVLALVGSYEALAGGLDRGTRARRQPGSAFKPMVYSRALHARRVSPSTVLKLAGAGGADGETREITVRQAVAKSDNAAAEAVLDQIGAASVVKWAQALGIESKLGATRSLALGAYEVTVLELANAYAAFPSGGRYAPAVLVKHITGPGGKRIELDPGPPARQVMQPDEAYLTTSLLRGVVEQGTARRARELARPVAGKTGTTNEAKDAWFAGYSPDLVAAVWVGYDDALPLGPGEQGAVTALPAWIDFMKAAHRGRPATAFARPSGVVLARVDPATGLLPYPGQKDSIEEEFLRGGVPNDSAAPADADADADEKQLDASAAPESARSTTASQGGNTGANPPGRESPAAPPPASVDDAQSEEQSPPAAP